MRKRILATAVALTAAMAGSLGAAAPAFASDHFNMTIRSAASARCLQPADGLYGDGVAIVPVKCDFTNVFQRWDFFDKGSHVVQIRNVATLKCMYVDGLNVDRTPVVQAPCNSTSNERFQASRNLPDYVTLMSRVGGTSTHCLDVGKFGDIPAMIYRCNGTVAQYFGVFPV